jgi:hypothetical protein
MVVEFQSRFHGLDRAFTRWGTQSVKPAGCVSNPGYGFVPRLPREDQTGVTVQRVMQIAEVMSNQTSNCFGVAVTRTGGGTSQSNGAWRDNLYLCDSPTCSSGGSCTFARDQTWKADGSTLSPKFRQTYTCKAASVTP